MVFFFLSFLCCSAFGMYEMDVGVHFEHMLLLATRSVERVHPSCLLRSMRVAFRRCQTTREVRVASLDELLPSS